MAELMFRCPYTNKPITSGIEIERDCALAMRGVPIRIRCPYCKTHHDGFVADGELREAA